MAALMIGEVKDLTAEVYNAMAAQMAPLMKTHKGFIAHTGGVSPNGGFRIVEIWESEADGQAWFDNNVKPNLPPGMKPDRNWFPLHNVVTK